MTASDLSKFCAKVGKKEVGLIKRLQLSTLAVILVMVFLAITLFEGGRRMVDILSNSTSEFQ